MCHKLVGVLNEIEAKSHARKESNDITEVPLSPPPSHSLRPRRTFPPFFGKFLSKGIHPSRAIRGICMRVYNTYTHKSPLRPSFTSSSSSSSSSNAYHTKQKLRTERRLLRDIVRRRGSRGNKTYRPCLYTIARSRNSVSAEFDIYKTRKLN